jgi:hypothetical protein
MKYFVTLSEDRAVASVMGTSSLSADVAAEQQLVEVSADDASIIEKYLASHDIVIDDTGKLLVYERLDQKIASDSLLLNSMVTAAISKGFEFEDLRFGCDTYDQINIHLLAVSGGMIKDVTGVMVSFDVERAQSLLKTMAAHVQKLMVEHWNFKERLKTIRNFREADGVINAAKDFYATPS